MKSYKYVILGTGQLGLALMDELKSTGESVALVNRSGTIGETLPANMEVIKADITNPTSVRELAQNAHAVFSCTDAPYNQWRELYPKMLGSVVEGVSQTNAVLVYADNLYMYGSTKGRPLREDLPYAAKTRKGKVRGQVATMVLNAHYTGRARTVIGRASDFFGPRVHKAVFGKDFLMNAFAGKPVNLLGNLDMPHTFTFIRDFAKSLFVLSQHPSSWGKVWHIPNAPTITTREMVGLFERELGHPIKVRTAGKPTLAIAGLFNPMLREFYEMAYEFEEPFIVIHDQFANAFGEKYTDRVTAIRETIASV